MDLINLTQIVNMISEGAQFQNFKGHSCEGRWRLAWEFYPSPKHLTLGLNSQNKNEIFLLNERLKGLASSPHPLMLYVKSHLLNQRISKIECLNSGQVKMSFLPSLSSWTFGVDHQGVFSSEIEIESRKTFKCALSLDLLKPLESVDIIELPQGLNSTDDANNANIASEISAIGAAEKKKAKLLKVIDQDRQKAQIWLDQFAPILEVLKINPKAWGQVEAFSETQIGLIQSARSQNQIPSFQVSNAKIAKDHLFELSRKMKKRLAGALKRFEEVYRQPEATFALKQRSPHISKSRGASSPKTVGHEVVLSDGIVAFVGTSATENAELFKKAKSRDLWFHVRSLAGGHVWIKRGQKGFGAKSVASEKLIIEGAKLALFNSKARRGTRKGEVDFTERCNLKSIKGGNPGQIAVLRSETRVIELDEEFEKLIKGK